MLEAARSRVQPVDKVSMLAAFRRCCLRGISKSGRIRGSTSPSEDPRNHQARQHEHLRKVQSQKQRGLAFSSSLKEPRDEGRVRCTGGLNPDLTVRCMRTKTSVMGAMRGVWRVSFLMLVLATTPSSTTRSAFTVYLRSGGGRVSGSRYSTPNLATTGLSSMRACMSLRGG